MCVTGKISHRKNFNQADGLQTNQDCRILGRKTEKFNTRTSCAQFLKFQEVSRIIRNLDELFIKISEENSLLSQISWFY